MNTILIEPVYAGPVSYFRAIGSADKVVFDVHAYYEKRSYRNRCEILGPNWLLKLSIPLEHGKHQKQLMKEVRISYAEKWQKDHWMSLVSSYRRAPFFEFYEDTFRPVYERRWDYLIDLNLHLFESLGGLLKLDIPFRLSDEYTKPGEFDGTDLRNTFLPNKKQPIRPYLQVFADRSEFVADLSILDALFNLGSRAMDHARSSDLNL